jgi:hypothetical protein
MPVLAAAGRKWKHALGIMAFVCLGVTTGCSDDSGGGTEIPDAALPDAAAPDAAVPDATSTDGSAPDAEPDGGQTGVGPLLEMPLLESPQPNLPFNHSAEVTVAAHDGHVALAYINMHFAGADTFETTGFHKRVGVAVSHDRGETFSNAIDPGCGDQTTDPVIRAAADGTFWLATWDTNAGAGVLASSSDHGESWQPVVSDISMGDKEWIAIDDVGSAVYLGAVSGFWKYAFDGTELAHHSGGGMMLGAYVDPDGAHFATFDTNEAFISLRWDAINPPQQESEALSRGFGNMELNHCASLGATADGGQWFVRAVREGQTGAVMLRVRHFPDDAGTDIQVNTPGTVAFFPAAALDGNGRLHLIWYEIGGVQGTLNYTHTLSADLEGGFAETTIIDPAACPGGDWYPYFISSEGGRRLREYIDITVDENRAHLAWTHAPTAPSRVYATYVAF